MDNPEIDEFGTKRWYAAEGNLHRVGGPAIEWSNGTKEWRQHGLLHRVGGPAVEWIVGDKLWYQHGKRHRDDGPAVIHVNGTSSWYLDNISLSFDKWLDKVNLSGEEKVMMKLKYG